MLLAAGGVPGTIQSVNSISGASPCDYTVKNDGSIESLGVGNGTWLSPANSAIAALYQVKVDATSGAFDSGTTGTWLDCSTSRSWLKSGGTVTFTISFREKATGNVRNVQTGVTLEGL